MFIFICNLKKYNALYLLSIHERCSTLGMLLISLFLRNWRYIFCMLVVFVNDETFTLTRAVDHPNEVNIIRGICNCM